MEEAIDILTKLKIQSHFNKQLNKEAKIDLVIKTLKVIMQYEWLWKIKREIR